MIQLLSLVIALLIVIVPTWVVYTTLVRRARKKKMEEVKAYFRKTIPNIWEV